MQYHPERVGVFKTVVPVLQTLVLSTGISLFINRSHVSGACNVQTQEESILGSQCNP